LAEVVSDDDGGLILAPLLDRLKDQDSGGGIESRCSFIYEKS
jgi:hypothetical protein